MRGPLEDPYAILGLTRAARAREIQRAFRRIALRDHPDHNPGDEKAAERFKRASAAYQRLKEAGWTIPLPEEPPARCDTSAPRSEASSVSEEPEPLPETWPDGTPIHYPTAEDIAAVVAAARQPWRARRMWWIRTLSLSAVALVLFVTLDWGMGRTQTVKGRVVSHHSQRRQGMSWIDATTTVESSEVWTELGTFGFPHAYGEVDVVVTTGWITGYRYAELASPPLATPDPHR